MATSPVEIRQRSPDSGKTDAEWRAALSPEAYKVTRKHGTERAGTSHLNNEKRKGMFKCVCCGADVFKSDTKFESGTGWPSFYAPASGEAVGEKRRQLLLHAPHRSSLRPLRGASRPRLPRWPAADRPALLHQRRGAEIRA